MAKTTGSKNSSAQPLALIIGFTIHGLALARALSRAGIEVHALSAHAAAATTYTGSAQVHYCPDIHAVDIVDRLLEFADEFLISRQAVLFPTNDNMVREIGSGWPLLQGRFLLSWSGCIDLTLKLQIKDHIPGFCQRVGIDHPESILVRSLIDCEEIWVSDTRFLVKPVRPLSAFKAEIIESLDDLRALVSRYQKDLPFIVQQYIDGEDDSLFFCVMYLAAGREIYTFTGQKLFALPSRVGQGTVMAGVVNDEIVQLSRRFLAGLNLSGPVAIEYKRDVNGRYWLIEPNVGRTEYCVDLLIQSGLNVPLVEYRHVTGDKASVQDMRRRGAHTWYDTEKDPLCYVKHALLTRQITPLGHVPIFPFYGHGDLKPLLMALLNRIRSISLGVMRKVERLIRGKRTTVSI